MKEQETESMGRIQLGCGDPHPAPDGAVSGQPLPGLPREVGEMKTVNTMAVTRQNFVLPASRALPVCPEPCLPLASTNPHNHSPLPRSPSLSFSPSSYSLPLPNLRG